MDADAAMTTEKKAYLQSTMAPCKEWYSGQPWIKDEKSCSITGSFMYRCNDVKYCSFVSPEDTFLSCVDGGTCSTALGGVRIWVKVVG